MSFLIGNPVSEKKILFMLQNILDKSVHINNFPVQTFISTKNNRLYPTVQHIPNIIMTVKYRYLYTVHL